MNAASMINCEEQIIFQKLTSIRNNEEQLTSAEIQREFPEEFVPRAPARPQPQPQQQREIPEKPIRIRPRPQDERAEPSIQQPVQQRRPNYPADYKPSRPQQVGNCRSSFKIYLIYVYI